MALKNLIVLVIFFIGAALPAQAASEKKILCSTFPIYQITRNVVGAHPGVTVQPLLAATLGCPHDYALTPHDMQKLARAEVLIINGLGLEEFLGAPVTKANPQLTLIDSSAGITELLHYTHEAEHDPADAGHDHEEGGVNPHLFASPRMNGLLALNIAGELAKLDPSGAEIYLANSRAYADRMNALARDCVALSKRLKNNRIITQHGVFDYLARDMGLEIVAVVQAHAGQQPSAAEMLQVVKIIKEKKAAAIFTEPQYPAKIGQTIAAEAGIVSAILDPVANGPENAPRDYYETVMRRNLQILEQTLGTK